MSLTTSLAVVSLGDMSSISSLVERANIIIQENEDGSVMSAAQTLGILRSHVAELKAYHVPDGLVSDGDSVASDASDLGNLTFTCKYNIQSGHELSCFNHLTKPRASHDNHR